MGRPKGSWKNCMELPPWIERFEAFPMEWEARCEAGALDSMRHMMLGCELMPPVEFNDVWGALILDPHLPNSRAESPHGWAQRALAAVLATKGVTERDLRDWADLRRNTGGPHLWLVERRQFMPLVFAVQALSEAESEHPEYVAKVARDEGQDVLAAEYEEELHDCVGRLRRAVNEGQLTHAKISASATPEFEKMRTDGGVRLSEGYSHDAERRVRVPSMRDLAPVAGAVLGWVVLETLGWLRSIDRCKVCGGPLPPGATQRRLYCSQGCNSSAYRRRKAETG